MTDKKNYIEFSLLEEKPKTKVYSVINIKFGNVLGIIKWYAGWRKYCFFSEGSIIYDVICLDNIRDFIQKLMDERNNAKVSQKLCDECIGQNHPTGDYCQDCALIEYRK